MEFAPPKVTIDLAEYSDLKIKEMQLTSAQENLVQYQEALGDILNEQRPTIKEAMISDLQKKAKVSFLHVEQNGEDRLRVVLRPSDEAQ